MSDTADANLVLAAIRDGDALHQRARLHLARHSRLLVPFAVGIELLHVARKRGVPLLPLIMEADERFEIEGRDILLAAARSVDEKIIPTVFDAVHVADARHRGAALHTADERLLRAGFPTIGF